MDMETKNKMLEDYINDVSFEINKRYKGLIDQTKIREIYKKFEDSDKDLSSEIIPEINKIVEDMIDNLNKLKEELKAMMALKDQEELKKLKSMNLGQNEEKIYVCNEKLNYLSIAQLDSKESVKNYIENACSKFPYINSQEIIDTYNSVITDEQIEEIKFALNETHKNNLDSRFSSVEKMSPEEARAKLTELGIDKDDLNLYVDKIARGESLEVLEELVNKYGEKVISKLDERKEELIEEDKKVFEEEQLEDVEVKYDELGNKIISKPKTKTLTYNGFGYIAVLVAIVSFGIGIISTITYLVISTILK